MAGWAQGTVVPPTTQRRSNSGRTTETHCPPPHDRLWAAWQKHRITEWRPECADRGETPVGRGARDESFAAVFLTARSVLRASRPRSPGRIRQAGRFSSTALAAHSGQQSSSRSVANTDACRLECRKAWHRMQVDVSLTTSDLGVDVQWGPWRNP
eukprot:4773075-Amphidinium_carterae.1